MGMFDTIHVDEKFLPTIPDLESRGIKMSSFQTKDLECVLYDYFIKEDGKMYVENNSYVTHDDSDSMFGFRVEKETSELKFNPYTGEILFYDCFTGDNGDSLFVDLKIKVIDGIASGPAEVVKIDITTKAELDVRELKFKKLWEKRNNDLRYQIYRFISIKISGLINSLSKIQSYLLKYDVE
jgi:hypothetical protein